MLQMINSNARLAVLLLATAVLLSACARRTTLVARCNPNYSPSLSDRIALPERAGRSPEVDAIEPVLRAELIRRGANVVPSPKSEYVLGYWIESNWKEMPVRIRDESAGMRASPALVGPRSVAPGSGNPRGYIYSAEPSQHDIGQIGQRDIYTKAIRLRLFVTKPKDTNRLETAWDGQIDGGTQLSAKEYDALLRVLLDHFGKNYMGRVRVVE